MNTASNWPMGSTLAQLNLELQTTPFATSKVIGTKTLTEGIKVGSTQSTIASSIKQPMLQIITSNTGPTNDVMKWTQTR